MNKKAIIGVLVAIVIAFTPLTSIAVTPVFTDHRTFANGLVDWVQTPANSWTVSADDEATTILNNTSSQTSLSFKNKVDISDLGIDENSEIDFTTVFHIKSEKTVPRQTPEKFLIFTIVEDVDDKTITITLRYNVISYYYASPPFPNEDWRIYIKSMAFTVEENGIVKDYNETSFASPIFLYAHNINGYERTEDVEISVYQMNYGGKTHLWLQQPSKEVYLETDLFIPEKIDVTAGLSFPSTLYNTTRNLTFAFPYFNIDVYAESIHKKVIYATVLDTIFDIMPMQNLIFTLLLTATFILSVIKPEKIPKTVGLLALTFAISIVLYSVIKYYSGSDLYAYIGGMLPIPIYLIRDKLPFRKGMFR